MLWQPAAQQTSNLHPVQRSWSSRLACFMLGCFILATPCVYLVSSSRLPLTVIRILSHRSCPEMLKLSMMISGDICLACGEKGKGQGKYEKACQSYEGIQQEGSMCSLHSCQRSANKVSQRTCSLWGLHSISHKHACSAVAPQVDSGWHPAAVDWNYMSSIVRLVAWVL